MDESMAEQVTFDMMEYGLVPAIADSCFQQFQENSLEFLYLQH